MQRESQMIQKLVRHLPLVRVVMMVPKVSRVLFLVVHLLVVVRNKILNQRPLLNQMLHPRNQNYLLYQEGKVQLYIHQQTNNNINPSELLTPYLPSIPVLIGLSAMSYLLLKYFGMLRKARKRYRRAYEVSGPPPLEEQPLGHVGDQADGPHEYTLVKERKQPRSVPTGRKKQVGKRPVGQRTIIDIHLEILDECQREDVHSTREDFFEILVHEIMGSQFIKEEKVPKEDVPKQDVQS
ncbi:SICA antigen [Plasmodium coatneyi]|uniref:SICA antigen n=1 Tax=Plasmodium coatneyi TaxID=208452 RepID=A0A1B1DTH0_9APIC|nr:SICA antigen [Plasmodium coatneyi]ANQ05939.1 SICA antigen [Plasmodium coatneyi]